MNHKRRDQIIKKLNGEIKTLADWCRLLGINYHTAYRRHKRGYSPERVFSPKNYNRYDVWYNNKKYTLKELCATYNLNKRNTYWRLHAGWDIKEIVEEPNQRITPTRKQLNPFWGCQEDKEKKDKLKKLRKLDSYKNYINFYKLNS